MSKRMRNNELRALLKILGVRQCRDSAWTQAYIYNDRYLFYVLQCCKYPNHRLYEKIRKCVHARDD